MSTINKYELYELIFFVALEHDSSFSENERFEMAEHDIYEYMRANDIKIGDKNSPADIAVRIYNYATA